MLALISIAQGIIEQGLVFSLIVMGIYITSRIIHFDDLTVEGSFGIGGALSAQTLLFGLHPLLGLPLTMLAGALCGLITGLLHTKLKLNNLISGIVVTTALFSITLKIAGSTLTLSGKETIFSLLPESLAWCKFLIILVPLNLALVYIIKWFLTTEVGMLLRANGDNPQMLTNLGKSNDLYTILALMLCNMLAALSGALFVQKVGYFSIWANVGILIMSLAGLILAQAISKKFGFSLILGALAYQAVIALTFELQIDQDLNKLITALLIVALIVAKQYFTHKKGIL